MLKALDMLEDLAADSAQDDDEIEETVVFLYLGIRLKPLLGKYNINKDKINEIATQLADNYFDESLSLDLMINSIYNYINKHKQCPSDILLSDNIEILLSNYLEA